MIEVQADRDFVRVIFPTEGMSAEEVQDFVTWLRVEGMARRSRLSESAAWQLAEEIKDDWWEKNSGRFPPPLPS